MSQNAFTPPSRPPSSASSSSTSNNVPRVHGSGKQQQSYGTGGGHDHTRPLPPPRLSETTTTANNNTLTSNNASSSSSVTSLSSVAPLTAPLAPLSTNSSFRSVTNSRNSTTGGTTGTATTSNNNNNNNNNNNINNNISSSNNSNNNSSNSSNNTSAPRHIQSNNSGGVNVVASSATGTSTSRVPSSTRPNLGEVTLTVPRPELERVVNEYVETPFRQANPAAVNSLGNLVSSNQKCLKNERRLHHHHHHHHQQQQHHHHLHHQLNHQRQINDQRGQQQSQESQQQQQQQQQQQRSELGESRKSPTTGRNPVGTQARNRESGGGVPTTRRQQSHLLQSSLSVVTSSGGGGGGVGGVGGVVVGAVTKQPVSFTKEPSSVLGSSSLGPVTALGGRLNNDPNLSIMCDFCGRCRCESCRQPPPLPSRWLCDNSCFCSAETALDYASCLCCVKGLFYHCADSGSGTDSEAGGNCADEPCSCTGPRRTARWACLGALTLVLPCLLCYWPLKGCVTVCEACYARHASQGCHCDPNAHGRHHNNTNAQSVVSRDSRDPEKRLLDPVTPEL